MYKNIIKRFLDILLSLLLLPFVFFIILIVGLLIKKEDKGSIFYFGKRLGKNEKIFKMYKLRSMKMNAPDIRNKDGSTFNSVDDPRLLKIGKFIRKTSIDELPQIINILLGEMSFVGPRPDLPEHINFYKESDIKKLSVLPGITGYNQAYYRNSIEWRKRLEYDVYYSENISFILDLKIIFKTIETVLFRKNIFIRGEIKSEK